MSSCVRNIRTKNYQNLAIGFQVTVENVGNAFLGHSVQLDLLRKKLCKNAINLKQYLLLHR